jgi:hypothetical protein
MVASMLMFAELVTDSCLRDASKEGISFPYFVVNLRFEDLYTLTISRLSSRQPGYLLATRSRGRKEMSREGRTSRGRGDPSKSKERHRKRQGSFTFSAPRRYFVIFPGASYLFFLCLLLLLSPPPAPFVRHYHYM